MTDPSGKHWRSFTRQSAEVIRAFEKNEIDMNEAYSRLEVVGAGVDDEIVEFVGDVLSEIDGFPSLFASLLALLLNDPRQIDVLNFMNEPV